MDALKRTADSPLCTASASSLSSALPCSALPCCAVLASRAALAKPHSSSSSKNSKGGAAGDRREREGSGWMVSSARAA
jgi:hypothetical protein